jgi:transcriptional regulator with XRE-family HTH domain
MVARNALLTAPPYAVEQSLKKLGAHLRTARLRRNLTLQEVATKIGTGPRAVQDAEKGKASTSAAVYAALLWAFDLLGQLDPVGDPNLDQEGQRLAMAKERLRARPSLGGLSDDF